MTWLSGAKIHFIGIGGVGVNALARYSMDSGAEVSGSDLKLNSLCKELQKLGAKIYEGEDAARVDGKHLIVYSSAIKSDNAELAHAREVGIHTLERQEFLHIVASRFKTMVGIAGTHGKTTTTAMLTHILSCCGRNFLSMIGGESVDFGNYVNNSSSEDVFVVEACEYKRNFLSLNPTVAVVTNVECDHPDCYKDISEVREAFDEYLSGAPIRIYAEGDSVDGYRIFSKSADGCEEFTLSYDGKTCIIFKGAVPIGNVGLSEGGEYNFKNAAFAIVVAYALGVSSECALKSLSTFGGVKRRFERGGDIDGVPVFFDFAHHPTEIKCALDRAGEYGKILAVFQPHTYSRTKAYFDDFVKVFGDEKIGALVLMPTYAARENPSDGCDTDALAREITRGGKTDVYLSNNAAETLSLVRGCAKTHNIIMFIGAGDIYELKTQI